MKASSLKNLKRERLRWFLDKIAENVCLKAFSTMKVGGEARYYTKAGTIEELREALHFAKERHLPFFILGKGSNCIFDDEGFAGLVIQNKIEFCKLEETKVEVGAGLSFSWLGTFTAKNNLSGLEFASGIPGTVGGAIYMNAGSNGSETKDFLESCSYLFQDGTLKNFDAKELQFSYRHSPFQEMKGALVSATFKLIKSEEARKKQIELIHYRKNTQPLKDCSAGCVFRNPANAKAGALIEASGLKGAKIGGAEVSLIHANFIVNKGHATSKDIKALIEHVSLTVKEKTGHILKKEVCFISKDGFLKL